MPQNPFAFSALNWGVFDTHPNIKYVTQYASAGADSSYVGDFVFHDTLIEVLNYMVQWIKEYGSYGVERAYEENLEHFLIAYGAGGDEYEGMFHNFWIAINQPSNAINWDNLELISKEFVSHNTMYEYPSVTLSSQLINTSTKIKQAWNYMSQVRSPSINMYQGLFSHGRISFTPYTSIPTGPGIHRFAQDYDEYQPIESYTLPPGVESTLIQNTVNEINIKLKEDFMAFLVARERLQAEYDELPAHLKLWTRTNYSFNSSAIKFMSLTLDEYHDDAYSANLTVSLIDVGQIK